MSRYSAIYVDPYGAGDARPTALTVVKDEYLVGKLTDKVMLITGGSAGIGVETARAFHATGAKLFLTVAKGRQCDPVGRYLQSGRDHPDQDGILSFGFRSCWSTTGA